MTVSHMTDSQSRLAGMTVANLSQTRMIRRPGPFWLHERKPTRPAGPDRGDLGLQRHRTCHHHADRDDLQRSDRWPQRQADPASCAEGPFHSSSGLVHAQGEHFVALNQMIWN